MASLRLKNGCASLPGLTLPLESRLSTAGPHPVTRSSNRLLGVQLCLTEGDGGQPQLIDCPEERDWELASGAECGETVTLPKGIEVPPACAEQTSSPCNSVPWLPSSEWEGGGLLSDRQGPAWRQVGSCNPCGEPRHRAVKRLLP